MLISSVLKWHIRPFQVKFDVSLRVEGVVLDLIVGKSTRNCNYSLHFLAQSTDKHKGFLSDLFLCLGERKLF